jgi:hypothetical protein
VKKTILTKIYNMKRHAKIASVLVVIAGLMLATSALAQYYTPQAPTFPEGWYISPPDGSLTFESPALTAAGIASIDLYGLLHTPGALLSSTPITGGWVETFDSTLTGSAIINMVGGPIVLGSLLAPAPPSTPEPVTAVTVFGSYTPGASGSWSTSMTILDWPATVTIPGYGSISLLIQCLNAQGQTTVSQLTVPKGTFPAGWYEADSYFDVQPEISLDDGTTWITADESVTMTLVPEPSGLALLGLGALCLAIKTRWGRK